MNLKEFLKKSISSFRKPDRFKDFQKITAFASLSNYELNQLNSFVYIRKYNSSEIIYEQGFPAELICFVLKGRVQIKESGFYIELGQAFGLEALFEYENRKQTALASEDSVLMMISQTNFISLIQKEKCLALKIYKKLFMQLDPFCEGKDVQEH